MPGLVPGLLALLLACTACTSAQERADEIRYQATLAAREGRIQEAVTLYERASRLDPGLVADQVSMGSALLQAGRVSDAMEAFRRAILLDPDNAVAHFNLGSLYLQQGRHAAAIESFRRVAALVPDFVGVQHMIGVAEQQRGHSRDAIMAFSKAVDADPNALESRAFLARLWEAEIPATALEAWQALLDAAQGQPGGTGWVGVARERLRELVVEPEAGEWQVLFDRARALLDGAEPPDLPEDAPARALLGRRLDLAVELFNGEGGVWRGLGRGAHVARNLESAVAEIRGRMGQTPARFHLKLDLLSHPARSMRAETQVNERRAVSVVAVEGGIWEPGVDGLVLEDVVVLPADAVTRNLSDLGAVLDHAALQAGVDAGPYRRGDRSFSVFRTVSALDLGPGAEPRVLPLVRARPEPAGTGPDAAWHAAQAAAVFLKSLQTDDGRFAGAWLAWEHRAEGAVDDPVLLARAARVLLRVGERGGDPQLVAAGRRALDRLAARLRSVRGGELAWLDDVGDTAATAAYALALSAVPGGARKDLQPLLVYLEQVVRPDGHIPVAFQPGGAGPSPYPLIRPGVVLAALTLGTNDERLRAGLETVFFRGQGGDLPRDLLADPFLAEAVAAAYPRRGDRLQADALLRAGEYALAQMRRADAVSVPDLAGRVEGRLTAQAAQVLALAWQVSSLLRIPRGDFRLGAQSAADHLRWRQVVPEETYYLRDGDRAVGGVRTAPGSNVLALTTTVAAAEAWLEVARLPVEAAPVRTQAPTAPSTGAEAPKDRE